MTLYIGLMSGTSLDGVDATLVDFGATPLFRLLAHVHQPFPDGLRTQLLSLNTAAGSDELHRAALAGNAVGEAYAMAVDALLAAGSVRAEDVRAIGAHGQTVRHQPGVVDGLGYTLQLNAPALLAERTGIDVIADFRSRDLAAGGVGAPLVPAFHRAAFGRPGVTVCVLNIGGMSNLTVLHGDGRTEGFDCGPGNALIDHWSQAHRGDPYDSGGNWAASGTVLDGLLNRLLDEPFFTSTPPKSTGRDLFNAEWLGARLQGLGSVPHAQDVQTTLTELTACTCASEVRRHAAEARELLVCGGGALNGELMRRLAARLPGVQVDATDHRGLPPNQVEACAFAWLAQAFVEGRPGNLSSVTGARGGRVLGALYPAGFA